MVSERNRIIELKEYLESLGININIGKTKARGNKGVFIHRFNNFRIDVSKQLEPEKVLPVVLHEFAHFIHYMYDKTLNSLDFVFDEYTDEIKEELINITLRDIPKEFAASLFGKKEELAQDIKQLVGFLRQTYPDFSLSKNLKKLELGLPLPVKFLLKYDRVNYFNNIISVDSCGEQYGLNENQIAYLKLKSKQRALRRINSRINKLNKYYKNSSELFARFLEIYYTKPEVAQKIAPIAYSKMKQTNIAQLRKIEQILIPEAARI